MKALETDRRRRYESATALSSDVERWLAGRPILARPAGLRTRLTKWVRRQPALAARVGVIIAAVLLLVGMFGVSSVRVRSALSRERLSAYVNGIALADRELAAGNLDRANRILEEDCQPHLRRWEWRYLKRLAAPELLAIPVQSAPYPPSMSFSPDGQHLAVPGFVRPDERDSLIITPSADDVAHGFVGPNERRSCIRIVNATNGKAVQTLGGHVYAIKSLVYSPDGRYIASIASAMRSNGDKVRVWEIATGRQLFLASNAWAVAHGGQLQSAARAVYRPLHRPTIRRVSTPVPSPSCRHDWPFSRKLTSPARRNPGR